MTIAITATIRSTTRALIRGQHSNVFCLSSQCMSFNTITAEDKLAFEVVCHPQQTDYEGRLFPLILKPQDRELPQRRGLTDWCQTINIHSSPLMDLLARYAVILFRDLPIEKPIHFDQFVKSFGLIHFPYTGGNAPRTQVVGDVFTANEAPPDKFIPYHHELAYQPINPNYLFIYCDVSPAQGGETSLVLSTAIYQKMADRFPALVNKLEKEGIIYDRIIPENDDVDHFIGRGWKSAFGTEDHAEAEHICKQLKLSLEWLSDGGMKTSCKLPAFGFDNISGKKTWFNHIVNFRLYNFNEEQVGPKRVAYVGNGESFPVDFMDSLQEVIEAEAVNIPWQKGDVMLIDNGLAMHARQPFKPPRSIMAALFQ